jgi:hypothetical protein
MEIYEVIFYLNRKQYLKKGTVEEQSASLPSTWHIRWERFFLFKVVIVVKLYFKKLLIFLFLN